MNVTKPPLSAPQALAPVVWARISLEPSLRDEWAVLAAHLKKVGGGNVCVLGAGGKV